ncbi:MAG TPA: neutral/alkaline non-lysosomal ceramidase N-terminal domain-containing protein [Thermoguttaceae bacterium]|nr:neutral/alkaline non-lysosomal ceramidase N-terminal domain-containing protein [Thermoguttaceae bacterium]
MIVRIRASRVFVGLCVMGVAMAAAPMSLADEQPSAFVGVAKCEITPETPIEMYGYASRRTESEGVAGRLKATAVAIGKNGDLAGGAGPTVLLAVDNGSVPRAIRDEVYARISATHTIRPERFVLCNAHNHSGPNLKGMASIEGAHGEHLRQYAKLLTDRLESVVLEALASRKPGTLACAQGSVDFATNRRVLTDGRWSGFGAVPEGAVDHSLPVMRVADSEGRLMAIVVNYACHNTTLRGNFKQIHGDWAGCAQAAIERAHPGAVALITIGCGADSDPCPHGTTELCEQHGTAVAKEVSRLLKEENWTPLPGTITAKKRFLEVSYTEQKIDDESDRAVVVPSSSGGAPPRETHDFETFQITTWTFGDKLAMVFLSDEVVVDYALRLKQEMDGSRLWISAYSNDVSRYIVSKRLIAEGGYEVRNSLSTQLTFGSPEALAPAMEDRIVEAVKELVPESFGR